MCVKGLANWEEKWTQTPKNLQKDHEIYSKIKLRGKKWCKTYLRSITLPVKAENVLAALKLRRPSSIGHLQRWNTLIWDYILWQKTTLENTESDTSASGIHTKALYAFCYNFLVGLVLWTLHYVFLSIFHILAVIQLL